IRYSGPKPPQWRAPRPFSAPDIEHATNPALQEELSGGHGEPNLSLERVARRDPCGRGVIPALIVSAIVFDAHRRRGRTPQTSGAPTTALLSGVDIRSRPDDPAVEELARSIYAMFPKCMRCGQPIPSYEAADVRIL